MRGALPRGDCLPVVVVPEQEVRTGNIVKAADAYVLRWIRDGGKVGPVAGAIVRNLELNRGAGGDARAHGCESGDVGLAVAVEVRDEEPGHGIGQLGAKPLPMVRGVFRIDGHPLIGDDSGNIGLMVSVEVTEEELADLVTRCGVGGEGSTGVGYPPLVAVGVKEIGATIAGEVTDDGVGEVAEPVIGGEGLPVRDAAPGDHPGRARAGGHVGYNIGAAIAIEVTEEKAGDGHGLDTKKPPLSISRWRVVPGAAGGHEQIVLAVTVKVADGEPGGGIGGREFAADLEKRRLLTGG